MRGLALKLKAQQYYDDITALNKPRPQNIVIDKERHIIRFGSPSDPNSLVYRPERTPIKLHEDREHILRIIIGAYGSGKSTGCCAELIFLLADMPYCLDGVRRAKCAVVRNTYSDLATTTIKTWEQWACQTGTYRKRQKPNIIYEHVYYDEYGKLELEVIFLALDREQDVRRLGSLELSWGYFNECQHAPYVLISHFLKRCGRYPRDSEIDKARITEWFEKKIATPDGEEIVKTPYYAGVIGDTNAPHTDHWLPLLEQKIRKGERTDTVIFHQPPALIKNDKGVYLLNPEAENIHNLSQGAAYYYDMTQENEEFIRVYAQGYYGISVSGLPVYPSYNDDFHSVEDIEIDLDEPIILGHDYGLACPATMLAQFVNGQLRFIKEFYGEYITVKELCETGWGVYLSDYIDIPLEEVDDPANTWHGREDLNELGHYPEGARTNNFESRVRAFIFMLNTNRNGQPALLVSRKGCPKFREALAGKYHYPLRRVNVGTKYADRPDKNHPHSDLADGGQYIALKVTPAYLEKRDKVDETDKLLESDFELGYQPVM